MSSKQQPMVALFDASEMNQSQYDGIRQEWTQQEPAA